MANRLRQEKSPYLLQHGDNPVDWYPWCQEAFRRARQEDKPVFLSIGYSTCHWCHVMAHESFENNEVADILNKNFISIKVDKEERPDIDSIYMQVCQAFTGSGNMRTLDVLYSAHTNKQFISLETKSGQTYYLVIDYDKPLDKDGEQYETYFLNLVDDRDLFGVVSKDEQPTPEPTATPTPKPTAEPKPEAERTTDSTAMMALVLLVVLIAGGAAAFIMLGKKKDTQPRYTELDDDDDEEEIGEENEEK